jgi:putative transposase
MSRLVFDIGCPKYRFRILRDGIREYTKQQIYTLCRQKELVEVMKLNVQEDHVHLVMSIAAKHSLSCLMGYVKG